MERDSVTRTLMKEALDHTFTVVVVLRQRPETVESRVRPSPFSMEDSMRIRSILGTLVIASLPVMPALAVDMTPEQIQKMVDDAVNKKMQEHERREGNREGAMERRESEAPPAGQFPVPVGPMTDIKVERLG